MNSEKIIRKFGARDEDIDSLLAYNKRRFDHSNFDKGSLFPISEELSVRAWRRYVDEAKKKGSYPTLRSTIIQLNFPIKKGISKSDEYVKATTEGLLSKGAEGIGLESVEFYIAKTPVGGIPIIVTKKRGDFEKLIGAISHKNEPEKIPASMGAATFSGYNNWERINGYKKAFIDRGFNEYEWASELQNLTKKKELYKDSFIILSGGPYSSISHQELGLDEESWLDISLEIRKYHELTHYFTKRALGAMSNNALDEILCDYVGIVGATDKFNEKWLLKFLGLESFPKYREGGRLQNYVGKEISKEGFVVLQKLVHESIGKIKSFHSSSYNGNVFQMVMALSYFTLEELAVVEIEEIAKKLEGVVKRWKEN